MKPQSPDILIVGGGVGGCAAAMAAASMGCRVALTEESDWLGGQLTSQAVPSDEHPWIEDFGCTRRYRAYREGVRQFYRDHYPLRPEFRDDRRLNPGFGNVSRICHEPRVGLAVIEQMLAPFRSRSNAAGSIRTLMEHFPVGVETRGDRIASVTLECRRTGKRTTIAAPYILDATELGDLLPLAGVEYVSGAESRGETGEPHAPEGPAQPDNVQAITWCFPMAFDPAPGANHVGDPPAQYARWRDYTPRLTPAWPGRLLDPLDVNPITLQPRNLPLFPDGSPTPVAGAKKRGCWWLYRRIVAGELFMPGQTGPPHDVTMVNWPRNDYFEGNIIDQPAEVVATRLEESRQLSLSLFHWLQTECPRPDGGQGYPGLYLVPEIAGTADGLAKRPYIRESRRIRALTTVTELHVGAIARGEALPTTKIELARAEKFRDTVGVGYYRIDLHMSTGGDNYIDISSLPFQIPLGSLIPRRVENLLAACKNLGVTHITNGCYRLHPVEWNIGESAGLLAAFCLAKQVPPRAVHERPALLAEFQALLADQGVELDWPDIPLR
ncbi:MAG: FAD-dependent oxidoreductase [Planctomycetota bacterium]|nr:FAD-dependent oxidoreductase [Planctomycetota bacterium]